MKKRSDNSTKPVVTKLKKTLTDKNSIALFLLDCSTFHTAGPIFSHKLIGTKVIT